IPKQLYYAAKVDGASDWKFLWKIIVPMAKPSIITICILVGINSWNAFLWPLLVTNSERMRLLANGLTAFQSDAGNQYELLMAASTIITMPLVIVYIFLHKKIMSGISIGGIKG
ncbi:carbohydrate ABC transporter permease, partial [Clostridium saudiense]|nr:carbohydrate ABC transporter permease [Clostridium saudiense]